MVQVGTAKNASGPAACESRMPMFIEHAAVCCLLPWFAEPGGCGFSDPAAAAVRFI
jgi:hypothetical protein